ncbi:MAG: ATP-dependent zinc metalloprotease FtsH [Bacilli bacterium]|nr:ATP-dependent zinc metalloprotease FtsH [Bacilli bacterium]
MALAVGLFIWLIASNLNRPNTWYESVLDSNLGYVYNTASNKYEFDTSKQEYKIKSYQVSQGYKAVTISGTAQNKSNQTVNFNTTIEEDRWNQNFVTTVTVKDGDGNKVVHYDVEHLSYATIFSSHEVLADGASYYVTDAFQATFWDTWGPTILTIGVTVLLGAFFFFRLSSSVNGANRQVMDFNKSPARRENQTKVRFADVAGCDAEKAEMVELVEYLKDPKKYSKFGARLPKGVLLIGPPGTGKTLLAKAVAGEANVPFYSISGSDFVEMYVGVGAGRVRDLFHKAKQTAPCLVFIDEIDAVGRQRGAGLGGGNDEREQTLNQLLVEMDGFDPNTGILVIAATNRDDVLDPALRRAGRFDRTITVSLPDKDGREAIFKVHARNKKISPNVDFGQLAKRTVGFSGADIDNVLNEAAILAVRGGKEEVDINDIDEAIDRRISGPAKANRGMSALERRMVAYHEAGHAVLGINVPFSDKVQKITIIPRGNTGGHVLMTPEDDRFLLTKNQLIARIIGLLGGRTSEEIFFQDISTGASNDIEEATRMARLMVTEWGMSELGPIQYESNTGSVFLGRDYTNTQKNFSTQIAFEIDKAVRKIIDDAHDQATKILTEKKDQVILIAETLLENETITAEEIDYLLANKHLPPKPTAVKEEAPKAEEKPVEEKPADPQPKEEEPNPEEPAPKAEEPKAE